MWFEQGVISDLICWFCIWYLPCFDHSSRAPRCICIVGQTNEIKQGSPGWDRSHLLSWSRTKMAKESTRWCSIARSWILILIRAPGYLKAICLLWNALCEYPESRPSPLEVRYSVVPNCVSAMPWPTEESSKNAQHSGDIKIYQQHYLDIKWHYIII